MKSRFGPAVLCLAFCLGVNAAAVAANNGQTLEQRLQRIERMLQNQSLADLVLQLQQLQREVQQLRGDVELQKHTMDAMSRRQRDLYLDIDQRLSRLQSGGAAAVPPPVIDRSPTVEQTPSTAQRTTARPTPSAPAPAAVAPAAAPAPAAPSSGGLQPVETGALPGVDQRIQRFPQRLSGGKL